jgi:transposase
MFQDEGRFGRISSLKRCWVPKPVRPVVPAQIVREYTYTYAAISPLDGHLDSLILPVVNSSVMSLFLEEVSRRHPDEHIVMVLDQASWHRSQELVLPENMTLLPLPPYSPELNPVEQLWKTLRTHWFANTVFSSMEALEDRLVQALRELENSPQRIQTLAGFDWIINSLKAI